MAVKADVAHMAPPMAKPLTVLTQEQANAVERKRLEALRRREEKARAAGSSSTVLAAAPTPTPHAGGMTRLARAHPSSPSQEASPAL